MNFTIHLRVDGKEFTLEADEVFITVMQKDKKRTVIGCLISSTVLGKCLITRVKNELNQWLLLRVTQHRS